MTNALMDQIANFSQTTVAGGAGGVGTTLNPGDTTLYLTSASTMPQPTPWAGFNGVLTNGVNTEIVRVTARSGATLTITRGQEGTAAATFAVGSSFFAEHTASTFNTVQSLLQGINNQYLYLPPGWDAAWKAAKANSGSTAAVVSGIGDSVTGGYGSSDALSKSWWALVRAAILAESGMSLGGDYYDLKWAGATFTGPNQSVSPIVQHGAVTTDYVSGYGSYTFYSRSTTTTLTPWLTFTSPYACVAIDIVYLDFAAGAPGWSYQVDGGTAVNVTTTGNGTAAASSIKKISITGLTSGVHTIAINSKGIAAGICICGFATYAQASAGLRFANHGWQGMGLVASGASSQDALADTTQFPPDRLGLHQGYTGTTGSPTTLRGFGFPTQPDLAIVGFGINDAIGAGSAATYRDALRRLCQALRYGKSDACSILIVGMYWGDGSTVSSTSVNNGDWTGTQYPVLQDLYEAMRKVAMEYNCAYASAHTLLGRTPATNGWTTSATDGHPTDSGHSKIATLLEPVL